MGSKRKLIVFMAMLALAGVLGHFSSSSGLAAEQERKYCFSDVCLGDSRFVLSSITLRSLSRITERPRSRPDTYHDVLRYALPGLSDAARARLSGHTDSRGSLLLDAETLPIFLGIDRVCAPVGPFVALFASESGHASIVEFSAIANGPSVQLGVTRVARSYRVKAGSSEERALIADLSHTFGFRIDGALERAVGDRDHGMTAEFTRQDEGFLLAFNGPDLREDARAFAEQEGCDRIKID